MPTTPAPQDLKQSTQGQVALARLLDLTADAVLVREFDTDVIVFWNLGAEEMYGFSREQAIGRVSHDLLRTVHPVPVEEAKALLARAGRWDGELIHTTADGRQVTVSSRWAVQWDDDRPALILETNTDITQRKRVEDDLRQSEERYRTIVDTANEGIWLIGLDARTVYANERMARMLGYTPAELAERTVLDCLFPGDEPLAAERIGQNLQGVVEQFDFRFRRKDGSALHVLGCTSPMRDGGGEIVGALGMFTDVTAQRDLEREKDDFLATVAHDLRSPLTTVKGLAQMLQRRLSRDGHPHSHQMQDGLQRIEQTANRMTVLINDLLDLTRLQMGDLLELNRRPSDLVQLIDRCVLDHREQAGDRKIVVDSASMTLIGDWDADRLERVLSNLFSNAIKYSADGTTITVTVTDDPSTASVVVTVQDQGIGIPADDLPFIFNRFHRGRNVSGRVTGTGIGLAGVKQIVEQHGGTIEVHSREDEGSTFIVRLPIE